MKDNQKIQLLQFLICKEFKTGKQDTYMGEHIQSNFYVPTFPCTLDHLHAVTCWRKDTRFHKEVIEYSIDDGKTIKTPPMDVEPIRDSVLFRWHKHRFPTELTITKDTLVHIKVILDWKIYLESHILIESK